MNELNQIKKSMGINDGKKPLSLNNNNIFEEINSKKFEGE